MKRNVISGLRYVDWSDGQRQSEFVNSAISALNALGDDLAYDEVCALSGCAFRTSFSMPEVGKWNHGNYHAVNAPEIIDHAFRALGYRAENRAVRDYESDRKMIMDSIDRGVPVIALEGVISSADACVISGYDEDGRVLLGYNPFMNIKDDHDEAPDETGYFRKTDWHANFADNARIVIIGEKTGRAPDGFEKTLALVARLIGEESLAPGQYNGLRAHEAFAHALSHYEWDDPFEPYLNTMCNFKQYIDRQYAVEFFIGHGRKDLAAHYAEIAGIVNEMGEIIPQDFSAAELFLDKSRLAPYIDRILRIRDIEGRVLRSI